MENNKNSKEKITLPKNKNSQTARNKISCLTSSNTFYKLTLPTLLTALVFVTTAFFPKISMRLGYAHIGDAFIWLASSCLSPATAAAVAAIGSGLADLASGYTAWIPATAMIKALSAWIMASYLQVCTRKHLPQNKYRKIAVSCICGICVAIGYLVYETLLFGFGNAITSFPLNVLQGIAGSAVFAAITFAVSKIGLHPKQK